MTLKETLKRIDYLHQLPESHPVSQAKAISLAHIDTPALLRRNRENFAKAQKKAASANANAASAFKVGQMVRTRRSGAGEIVLIDGGKISVRIGDDVSVYYASSISAA